MSEPPDAEPPNAESWQERRRAAAADLASMLREFAVEAQRRGIPQTALLARGDDGRTRYRTGLQGWYLRRNRTLGVDTAGTFYILSVPASFTARFTGVQVPPADPPLVIGAGGRDGESIPLPELLALRLEAGAHWE